MKDWNGNKKSTYVTLGASNHTDKERQAEDYYATDPKTIAPLFAVEQFDNMIWECACGEGHLSKAMEEFGKDVFSTDKFDRGFGQRCDFLTEHMEWHGDIITNPPYKYAQEFVQKSIKILKEGKKVAMFLKIQFLEGQGRRKLFNESPPKIVYVFSKRQSCAMNGEFDKYPTSAVAYAWFVWEKGYKGETMVRWL
jgi:hypothetical protein